MANRTDEAPPTVATLVRLSVPAILVGVVSGLGLFLVEEAAHLLKGVLWTDLPSLFGLDPDSRWWIFAVLSVVGLTVGLICTFAPGRGGRDSATVELLAPPIPLAAVPGLILVSLLVLAGGVSLGPESPIIAINTAIVLALVVRLWPRIDMRLVVLMTAAGTIGALFGTPVAAALVLTGVVATASTGGALWDRLFLPLLAAAAGSLTMRMIDGPQFEPTARGTTPLGSPGRRCCRMCRRPGDSGRGRGLQAAACELSQTAKSTALHHPGRSHPGVPRGDRWTGDPVQGRPADGRSRAAR